MTVPRPAAWLLARPILSLIGLALLFAAAAIGMRGCQRALQAPSQARLATKQGEAASESGKDAVAVTGAAGARESASDALTRENEHAIRTAPGAGAPVDTGVHDAGLAGLCRRAAYRGDPKCLQFTPPR